jgi:hypothetical protein
MRPMENDPHHLPFPVLHVRTGLAAGALTVYGSDGCSWTRKQLAYLDDKHIAYRYVNCTSEQCPDFVKAFPTLDQDGKILVGFQKI